MSRPRGAEINEKQLTLTATSRRYLTRLFARTHLPRKIRGFIKVKGDKFISCERALLIFEAELRPKPEGAVTNSKTVWLLINIDTFLAIQGLRPPSCGWIFH